VAGLDAFYPHLSERFAGREILAGDAPHGQMAVLRFASQARRRDRTVREFERRRHVKAQ
jgi:hypothetical protein